MILLISTVSEDITNFTVISKKISRSCEYMTVAKIKENYIFSLMADKHNHTRQKLVLYEYIITYVENFTS
jgi:hypothetical protein